MVNGHPSEVNGAKQANGSWRESVPLHVTLQGMKPGEAINLTAVEWDGTPSTVTTAAPSGSPYCHSAGLNQDNSRMIVCTPPVSHVDRSGRGTADFYVTVNYSSMKAEWPAEIDANVGAQSGSPQSAFATAKYHESFALQ